MKKYINIYLDILYRYSSSNYLDVISKSYLEKISPSNIFKRLWICLVWLVRDITNPILTLYLKTRIREINPKGKIWIFVASNNHFDSIGFLKETLEDAIFVVPHIHKLEMTDFIFPYYFKVFYYFKFPFLWLKLLIDKNKIAYRYFNFLVEAIGVYEISIRNLKKYKPKAIIFANDHIFKHRALLLAAKELNIKTCYIQHASVSNTFPPLLFNLSLLEGKDSLNKYIECGEINSIVELVGMPKFDKYVHYKKEIKKNIQTIGIAVNLLDDLEIVYQLIQKINEELENLKIIVRLHPLDKRVLRNKNILFEKSNPAHEKAFEFLRKIDLLISGESSIHLEAALLHIPSIIYGFNENNHIYDYYEYVKNGLIQMTDNLNGIIEVIKINEFEINNEKLKYYNEVVGTEWEGKSKELIIQIINRFLN